MSVTAPHGFRAAGVAAGIKAGGGRDVALVVNDGPSRAAAAVFTAQPGEGRARCCGPSRCSRRPGARGRAQLRRRQRLHRPAGFQDTARHRRATVAAASASRAGRGRGLLHRPDRRAAADGRAAGRRRRGGRRAVRRRRRWPRPTRSGPPTPSPRSRSAATGRLHGRRHGQGRRHARPGARHDAVRASPPTPTPTPAARQRAAARRPRSTFDRLDSDGCMSTNDTVLLLASGASGVTATRAS